MARSGANGRRRGCYGRRIDDPFEFFQRSKDERCAQTRLYDIVDGGTRGAIANHDPVEVVRMINRSPVLDESQTAE
ncbi:MAG: hypothetical protein R2862_07895 [Thermoanaerobaculia bacterium]